MSSDKQHDSRAKLVAQRRAIVAACKRHGWQPLEAVEQTGLSAEDLNRPGIQQTLRLLEASRFATGSPAGGVVSKGPPARRARRADRAGR